MGRSRLYVETPVGGGSGLRSGNGCALDIMIACVALHLLLLISPIPGHLHRKLFAASTMDIDAGDGM